MINSNNIKRNIIDMFKAIGISVGRVPANEVHKYTWLDEYNIKTIFDVGANRGQFALEITNFVKGANVYSFEPLREQYYNLKKNCTNIENFMAFNVALGNINGSSYINHNEFSQSSSILEMSDIHKEAFPFANRVCREEIRINRLDDLIEKENIDIVPNILLKLDVQGFESDVLAGAKQILKSVKIIISEVSYCKLYDGQELFNDFCRKLDEIYGFEYKGPLATTYHPDRGVPLFSDGIFMKK